MDRDLQKEMLEEYKDYLYKKKMQNYIYQCERVAPHVIHNAEVKRDGDQWCCVLGDLATGVAGFGDTPGQACAEFDKVWRTGK